MKKPRKQIDKIFFLILALSIAISISYLVARSFRVSKIPNGGINSCVNCHISPFGGGPRNSFGHAVEGWVTPDGEENFWGQKLANLDSDGDGYTNGQELQDPKGLWHAGMKNPGNPSLVTNPGDPNSHPNNTSGSKFLFQNALLNCYFNPLNSSMRIAFSTRAAGFVSIEIYDLTGRVVKILINGYLHAGVHHLDWNLYDEFAKKVTLGIYFYRMTAGDFTATKSMVILK